MSSLQRLCSDDATFLVAPATAYDEFVAVLVMLNIKDVGGRLSELLQSQRAMSVSEKLQLLDKLKSWLDSFRPFPPDVVGELKKLYDVRFTYHSNAIEGNTLTQSETEMILEKGITVGGKTLREHLEVVGHKEAIDYIEELAQTATPIGEREIKDLHSMVMRGVDHMEAGRYRRLDTKAAGTEHLYPAHYLVQELMEVFVRWLDSAPGKNLHPIVYATQAHYRFVSIHPFKDGNGRTGRLLMNLMLLRSGCPVTVIPNEKRKEYIEAIVYADQNNEDTGNLVDLIADASRESLVESLRILSTAYGSKGKGLPFYQELLVMLKEQAE